MDTRLRNLLILSLTLHVLVVFAWHKPSVTTTVYQAHETLNVRLAAKQTIEQTKWQTIEPAPQPELQAQSQILHPTKPAITTDRQPVSVAQVQHPATRELPDESHASSSANLRTTTNTQSTSHNRINLPHKAEAPSIVKFSATQQAQAVIAIDKSGLNANLQQRLYTKLASHFSYPRLAQRRNWQGEVKLGLRIEANGRLSHIRIIKSSGHGILDRAALRSLQAVSSLPESRQWLHGIAYDTVIPIEYRLTES